MDTFEAQPLSEDDGNVNNLEHEEAAFSIKYLTSSKLMGLEVNMIRITDKRVFKSLVYVFLKKIFIPLISFLVCAVERSKFPSACSCAMPHTI